MTDYLKYLKFLKNEIHSTIMATVDENNHPVTCVIDIMLVDSDGLYFLTAKGKSFYKRLKNNPFVSVTGLKGETTMTSKSITVRGEVKEIGQTKLTEIFKENPYMAEIYPTEESRKALTVFHIYKGNGEFFDLSTKPITRASFTFGDIKALNDGYFINDNCVGCNLCVKNCPQNCIDTEVVPYKIEQNHCLHCGRCKDVCPNSAVELLNGGK